MTASQSILATSPTLISISCQVLFRTVSGLRSRKDNTMQAPIYINKNKYLYVECQSWHRGVRSPEKGLSSPHLQTQCFTSDPLVMKTGFSRLVSFFPEQLELPFFTTPSSTYLHRHKPFRCLSPLAHPFRSHVFSVSLSLLDIHDTIRVP